MFAGPHREAVHRRFGDLDATTADMTVFFAAGTVTLINTWLVEAADPLDPEALADRLTRVGDALRSARAATGASARP